ncbi:MAG: Slp family lipoprotein [Nitrospirae bacterium]|nr:Slp family lipoprotein [Nitrospirota bacterium]
MKSFVSLLILLTIITLFGCAHIVSDELRQKAYGEPPAYALFKDPDSYKGRIVILGGVIISSTNTKEGTYIEVLQKPLDYRGRPEDTDISFGRFIVLYEGYLDTAVYSQGREITVAGEVIGKTFRPLNEIQYPYLLIKSKEIHLLEARYNLPLHFGIGIGVWHAF